MQFIDQYKGLPKQIYILLAARIISAMGMFVYPFLTLFLSTRMGYSEMEIGRFMLLVALSYIPAATIGGKIADRFNRKLTLLIAMLCADTALIGAGFLYQSLHMVWLLLISFFFLNMSMPVYAAMMMDITIPENRQESFSLIYLGVNIGGAVGPMAAGFLFENHIRWIFWGEAILNLCALILIGLFIRDTLPGREDYAQVEKDKSRAYETARHEAMLQILLKSPVLIAFAVCASALSFAYAQIAFMLPLQMKDLFGVGDGAIYYGLLSSLNCLTVVAATPFLVLVTKRITPLLNVAISGFLYMVGFGLYGIADHLALFYFLTVVWTLGEIISATNMGVYIANHSPISHRARFQSIFDIIQGTGRAIGPLVIGYYLMVHSISQAWALIAAICFIAALALIILNKLGPGAGFSSQK